MNYINKSLAILTIFSYYAGTLVPAYADGTASDFRDSEASKPAHCSSVPVQTEAAPDFQDGLMRTLPPVKEPGFSEMRALIADAAVEDFPARRLVSCDSFSFRNFGQRLAGAIENRVSGVTSTLGSIKDQFSNLLFKRSISKRRVDPLSEDSAAQQDSRLQASSRKPIIRSSQDDAVTIVNRMAYRFKIRVNTGLAYTMALFWQFRPTYAQQESDQNTETGSAKILNNGTYAMAAILAASVGSIIIARSRGYLFYCRTAGTHYDSNYQITVSEDNWKNFRCIGCCLPKSWLPQCWRPTPAFMKEEIEAEERIRNEGKGDVCCPESQSRVSAALLYAYNEQIAGRQLSQANQAAVTWLRDRFNIPDLSLEGAASAVNNPISISNADQKEGVVLNSILPDHTLSLEPGRASHIVVHVDSPQGHRDSIQPGSALTIRMDSPRNVPDSPSSQPGVPNT